MISCISTKNFRLFLSNNKKGTRFPVYPKQVAWISPDLLMDAVNTRERLFRLQ